MISINWDTRIITIPQSDLIHVSGTLYELDTDWFRLELKNLEDDEIGMAYPDTHKHSTEVLVAGITYARVIEIINNYSILFSPDLQYTVRLAGSNNNIFDVENGILNQNQVQVIAGNSAGLIVGSGSGSWTNLEKAQLRDALGVNGSKILSTGGKVQDIITDISNLSDKFNKTQIAAETVVAIGSTSTNIRTTLSQSNDFFNNMQVIVINTSGVAVRNINDFIQIDGEIIVDSLPFVPAIHDPVIIVARTGSVPIDASLVADAVWDEPSGDHMISDTMGELQNKIDSLTIGAPKIIPGD